MTGKCLTFYHGAPTGTRKGLVEPEDEDCFNENMSTGGNNIYGFQEGEDWTFRRKFTQAASELQVYRMLRTQLSNLKIIISIMEPQVI